MIASILRRAGLGLLIVSSRAQAQTAAGAYQGTPATIPGGVTGANFDLGGQDVGYYDSTPTNIPGDYRPGDAVDIALFGAVYFITDITVGEYLRFTVDIATSADAFGFQIVVASDQDTGSLRLVSGGTGCDDYTTDLSGTVAVPNTGDLFQYTPVSVVRQGDGGLDAGLNFVWFCPLSANFNLLGFFMEPLSPGPYGDVSATVPGVIEAEEFDYGGEGVAYSDKTEANTGGEFRPREGVDIKVSDTGYKVVNIKAGEYLRYSVDVTEDVGEFFFNFLVSSKTGGGSFRVVSGGTGCDGYTTDLSGLVSVPPTGGFNNFFNLAVSGEGEGGLDVGSAIIWLCALSSGFNIDSFTMSEIGIVSTPYSGTPVSVPGLIEAENFDIGGQGLAYYDTTKKNEGKAFRTDESVDVGSITGGYYVGWMETGEFLHYTVNVVSDVDALDFSFRVSAPRQNRRHRGHRGRREHPGSFRIVTGGTGCDDFTIDLSGLVTVPGGRRSDDYKDVPISNAGNGGLSAGTSIIRLCVVSGNFNIDSFTMADHSPQP